MDSLSSLHLSFCVFSDFLEHGPYVIWSIFTCVVFVAVHRKDMLGGGVVVFH